MLSIVIPTLDCDRALVQTLAPLVPGATSGLVSEVVVADGGSRDDTATVADVAGCVFLTFTGTLGARLKAAADATRSPWLLFLRPGTVLDTPWTGETLRFVERHAAMAPAAMFRGMPPAGTGFRQIGTLVRRALGREPGHGLLIAKPFYQSLGGHAAEAKNPDADILRRIGRRRVVVLSSRAFAQIS